MTRHHRGVNGPQEKKQAFDLAFRQHVRHYIDTAWLQHLTPSETKVMNLLCARTIYWGKVWEVVTAKHFVQGCEGQFAGTGMTKKTVLACLASLLADGFVRRRKAGNTWAYSVNVLSMGTDKDPARGREAAHRVRLSEAREFRIAKARAMRDLTKRYEETGDTQYLTAAREIGARKALSGGCKISTLREYIIPPPSESETNCSSYSSTARSADGNTRNAAHPIDEGSDMIDLPERRPTKSTPTAEDDSTPATGTRRRVVLGATKNNPATEKLVSRMRTRTRPVPAPQKEELKEQPTQPESTAARIQQVLSMASAKGKARRDAGRRGRVSPAKLQSAWKEAMHEHYAEPGQLNWGHKHKARAKSILIIHAELPEASMSWVDVFEWYVREYAYALQLAVPFMVRTDEQKADLLTTPPRLSLLLHFAKEFMEAYHRQTFGVGYPEATYEAAESLQEYHENWVERRQIAASGGLSAVPAQLRTDDELLAEARDTAPQNPEVAQSLREFDAFDEIDRHMRATGATQAETRGELRRAETMMHRETHREEYEDNLSAVQADQRESVRLIYGDDLTDEECDDILKDMYEDQD